MGVMLERPENERPRLFLGASELPISISHTRGIAGIAVSLHPIEHHPSNPTAIGIDIERADRIVAPALLSRMRHPDEELDAMGASAIQLWTLKEAALKWLGTGLRTPMNSVRLTSLQKEGTPEGICLRFKARFSTGNQVELCSFRFMSYWISTAFDVQANP